MPEIKMATEFEDYQAWKSNYHHVFMESLGEGRIAVGQWAERTLARSYHVSDLNPRVRENFEERLRYSLTEPDVG